MLLLTLGLMGCGQKQVGIKEYIAFCADSNKAICTNKELEGLKFKLQYLPTDLMILQRTNGGAGLSVKLLDSLRQAYDTLQFYTLTIENLKGHSEPIGDQDSPEAQGEVVDYFSFGAQQHFSLLQNTDTLPCILYHFERSYHLAPTNAISLAFKGKGKGDRTLRYDDKVFGLGRLNLTIRQKNIDDFPKLKIK